MTTIGNSHRSLVETEGTNLQQDNRDTSGRRLGHIQWWKHPPPRTALMFLAAQLVQNCKYLLLP